MKCQLCGKITMQTFMLPADKLPYDYISRRIMGDGAYEGTCKKCNAYGVHGDEGLCAKCASISVMNGIVVCKDCRDGFCSECSMYTEVIDEHGVCPICNAKYNFRETHTGTCADCTTYAPLNEINLCLHCASHKKVQHILCENCDTPTNAQFCSACTYSARVCPVCKEHFIPTEVGQILCNKHRKACKSCNTKFDPHDKSQVYCSSCFTAVNNGVCTACGTLVGLHYLDEHGWCDNCNPHVGQSFTQNYCEVCHIARVDEYGEICNNCKVNMIKCPLCLKNEIHAYEYLCETCSRKR